MLPMQPFSGKLRCPCVRGSRVSQSARRTRHTSSLVVTVDQRKVHPPSRPPIKIKIPALCLRRTQTQGRGTLQPETDAGGKSQADAGGGGTGQGDGDAAGHDSVVGQRPGTRSGRSGRRGGGRSCSAGVGGGGLCRHERRRKNSDEKGLRQERPDSARRNRSFLHGRCPRSAAARDYAGLGGTRAQKAVAGCEFGECRGGGGWLPGRYKLVGRRGRGWAGGEVGGSAGPFSKSARRGAPRQQTLSIKQVRSLPCCKISLVLPRVDAKWTLKIILDN